MSNSTCAVYGCNNSFSNTRVSNPEVQFYKFSKREWQQERMKKWISFVKRKDVDGKRWLPTSNSVICSTHFVGNQKSEHPLHPSYIPSIRNDCVEPKPKTINRFNRAIKRKKTVQSIATPAPDLNITWNTISTEQLQQSCTHLGTNEATIKAEDEGNLGFMSEFQEINSNGIEVGRMSPTSISVWFVCKLCRGSFGQVDAFIEHKKEMHFNEFQNTTCIIFEEIEQGEQLPVIMKVENQLMDEFDELPIKTEVKNEPIDPVNFETNDEPNSGLFEPMSEIITYATYASEVNPENESNFFGLEQPEQNPYVLLKRLTSDEIRGACVRKQQFTLLKCEPKDLVSNLELSNISSDVDSDNSDLTEVEKARENQPSATDLNNSTEDDFLFECKLCSKQLQSEAQLKIHVGICSLYHEDRNRFCVICNRKFSHTTNSKYHRLRFHGTEEEKMSLYKFKCHICLKQYRESTHLRFHLESHKRKNQQVGTSKSKFFKCSQPNCGKEFTRKDCLQLHVDTIHLGLRPFSCHFPNCNKTFSRRSTLDIYLRIHTGERPFKCTVDNCNKAFTTSSNRSDHHRSVHCNL